MTSHPEVELDELYRDLILDHSRRPRNRRTLDEPKLVGEGYNPLCGDEVEVEVRLDGDVISDIGFGGRGCSISQASVSMMTEAVKGKRLEDARLLVADFLRMSSTSRTPGISITASRICAAMTGPIGQAGVVRV